MTDLVLASASPRRSDLLRRAGLAFDVYPSSVDEDALQPTGRAESVARQLARAKALDVAGRRPEATVIAADTVVVQRGTLLGKPAAAEEARAMLQRLRGRSHRVVTAVAVARAGSRRVLVAHALTGVRMRAYEDEEIEASIARGDPFDKAGGYAIQDHQLRPVASYQGCYCNVVGLPVGLLPGLLARAGLAVHLQHPLPQCAACPYFR